MRVLQNISIKNKLIILILLVSLLALGTGFTIFIINDINTFEEERINNTVVNAKLIGEYCVSPLAFQDKAGATEILAKLKAIPSITNGFLYDDKGALFAEFNKSEEKIIPPPPEERASTLFEGDYLNIFQPISYHEQKYGTIYLRASTTLLDEKIKNYLITMVLLVIGLTVMAYFLALKLQGIISIPILKLAHVTEKISKEADYSLRVQKLSNDETGVLYDGFNNMLEQIHIREMERQRAEEALRESENSLKEAQRIAHLGNWDRDLVSNELRWSDEIYRIFGLKAQECEAKHEVFLNAIHPEDRELVKKAVNDTLHERKPYSIDHRIILPNGVERIVHEQAEVIFDETGTPVRLIGTVQDITERKRAEEELRKHREHLEELVEERTAELAVAKEQAEAADRLKSAFLASMSHELRTPLNSIIGFTGIILQGMAGPLNNEQTKQLEMVRASSNHLLSLINDILDISKIEAGQLEIVSETFDMREAIEKVVHTVTTQAEKKKLALVAEIAPHVGQIVSDRRRVEQIIINLLNNAVKFTEKGEVRIECQVSDCWLVTRVVDTGIGIKPEDMDKLFKVFQQIGTGLNHQHEGTGLGLSISKKLVEMLGGEIRAESQWGVGSTFTFTLPIKQGEGDEKQDSGHRG